MRLSALGGCYQAGQWQFPAAMAPAELAAARQKTIAAKIIAQHNTGTQDQLALHFDALASHDITYVGIVQTAKASGLDHFPIPYILTNCHNSLCAVGGTINADDHRFGLSAAQKYGGIFVPPHLAVIHQYMREMVAGCGKMILGSDSHTRYGALGTLAIGEGGGELVKQLLGQAYELARPEVVAVELSGQPKPGIGPQDVALTLIKAVFAEHFVTNKILEFIGPGIANLPMDFRNGIDVMTTETTCLSSIWQTDDTTRAWLATHGRVQDYHRLAPDPGAYYDRVIQLDLSTVEAMIALPFHPSNAYSIHELNENLDEIIHDVEVAGQSQLSDNLALNLHDHIHNGRLYAQEASIAGCAGGTYGNIHAAASLLAGQDIGPTGCDLSVYPASMPVAAYLMQSGEAKALVDAGAIMKTAFCGPCFGGGETPANGTLAIRHTTRNFVHREGSKPAAGQLASVALMDARSIAASVLNGGAITAGTDVAWQDPHTPPYVFDDRSYHHRVFQGSGQPQVDLPLQLGPNIKPWPELMPLPDQLLLQVASVLTDPVTTTDELIPSGETSSYRSNPELLANFTLSRKDPEYVGRARAVQKGEKLRQAKQQPGLALPITTPMPLGTLIAAQRPGDGSAREQAASCQKVLGGWANVAVGYATKRYRSNLINWGILPLINADFHPAVGDWLQLAALHAFIQGQVPTLNGRLWHAGQWQPVQFTIGPLTAEERAILLAGGLINYNRQERSNAHVANI
ncbi:hydratase [Lacticaseibacillus baoqingensis]|uniref:aconitate hydratase n=1 Tax=Lacticaseibacillus baoqingensis TaxID=2486013 RepID=A0ABW4EAS5_9LACO|nr:hydratase [Lacticaseibacillus baoqingensis]